MRLTASILAILILVLCMWPCAEAHGHLKSEVKIELKKSHSQQEDHIDLCSPFCHCSCSTLVIEPQPAVPPLLFTTIYFFQTSHQEYISSIGISLHSPIWQPPRA